MTPSAATHSPPDSSHGEGSCSPAHIQLGNRLIFTPFTLLDHQPLATVPIAAVQELVQEGLLEECSGEEIYRHQGHGIVTICSDPSLFEFKQRALQRRGNFAPYVLPGIGLRFAPESARFQPELLSDIEAFLVATKGHFNLDSAFVIGAHYPCGWAVNKAGEKLSLRETVEQVASGACYIRDRARFKVIATIFITARTAEGFTVLGWYHVKKNNGRHKKRPSD